MKYGIRRTILAMSPSHEIPLADALLRRDTTDGVASFECCLVVLWLNDEMVLTTSEDAFFRGERIAVRGAEWMLHGIEASLSPCIGSQTKYFEKCLMTGRLTRRDGVPEFTEVSRCVIYAETIDQVGVEVRFEVILKQP
jgi:hypothetical protein